MAIQGQKWQKPGTLWGQEDSCRPLWPLFMSFFQKVPCWLKRLSDRPCPLDSTATAWPLVGGDVFADLPCGLLDASLCNLFSVQLTSGTVNYPLRRHASRSGTQVSSLPNEMDPQMYHPKFHEHKSPKSHPEVGLQGSCPLWLMRALGERHLQRMSHEATRALSGSATR